MSNGTATEKGNHADARALVSAADAGAASRVTSLVAAGSRVDARLPNGGTPLMRAAARGFEDVARVLLDAGADVNARRGDGFTPLVLAVFFGHESVVRLLLERGADTAARTRLGTTARHWADARGFAEIAALLPRADDARPPAPSRAIQSRFERAPVEEVSIFSRKLERGGVRAAFASADAGEAGESISTVAASASTSSALASTSSARISAADDSAASASAANVSVRRDERVPSHPSVSTFRLRNFLRSWQASVGTAMLLLAFGVGVFALWRDGKMASRNQRPVPTPQSPASQTVAQPPAPAQSLPAPQASPVFPTPDAQSGVVPAEMPGAAYVVPVPAGQPYYNPPNPGQATAPKEPTVISESGAPSSGNASRPKGRADATAHETSSSATTGESRDEPSADDNSRAVASPRNTHTTETQPARPSPSAPAPSATPERGKVIQWPPQ